MAALEAPTRRCTRCGVEKPRDSYWRDKHASEGLQRWCKDCINDNRRLKAHDPNRVRRRRKRAPAAALSGLAGVRIRAGQSVTLPESAPDLEQTVTPSSVAPRSGTITCRQWIRQVSPRRRLFLCENGRYAVEQMTNEPGQAPRFLVWHLASDHRQAESMPCDASAVILLLSFIAPGVLDAPGTIFSA